MKLKDIKVVPGGAVYVNMTSPQLIKGAHMFPSNLRWDGKILMKPVHNAFYTRSGWAPGVNATLDELNGDGWEVMNWGDVPLDAGVF